MKSLKYLICIVMLTLPFAGHAQRMLSQAAAIKGVSSVFIGKTMLSLAGASMSINGDQSAIDLSRLFKSLSSIEILSCDEKSASEQLGRKCNAILSKLPFEVLSEVTGDGQNVRISGVFDKDGRNVEMLLVAVTGKSESSFILMKGKIDTVTLNNAILTNKSYLPK